MFVPSKLKMMCNCLKDQKLSESRGPPVFCTHGTRIGGDCNQKAIGCQCPHEDMIEQQNPYNRDWMDPTWTYEGSNLKKILDEARKEPPTYCRHGKCITGGEQGYSRGWWSQYYQRTASKNA